jgi:cytochrome d ubiquinol oxidase subunit II
VRIVRLAAVLSLPGFLTFFVAHDFLSMLLAMAVLAFFWSAALPLVETITFVHLRDNPARYSRIRLWGSIGFIVAVSLWTPLASERIAERWFSWPNLLWFSPVPILTFGVAALLRTSLRHERRDVLPFLCSFGLFFLAFTGLVISLWPYLIWPTITLWDAAAHPISQAFLLVGTMFLLPIILLYVIWSYWVFRGKVRAGHGYY